MTFKQMVWAGNKMLAIENLAISSDSKFVVINSAFEADVISDGKSDII